MAHELDITDGVASFVSAHEDAWHHLGETVPDNFTAEEAMKFGNLGGWAVRKTPLFTTDDDGTIVPVPGRSAVLRTNPILGTPDVLGDVGNGYKIVQNEEHTEFLQNLVDEGGANLETAGALYGGRVVFVTMKLPGHLLIGGVDKVDMNIAAINSHDGSMSFTLMTTPVRVVCANTLNMAFGASSGLYRIRHTSGAMTKIDEARHALNLSFDYLDEFNQAAEKLIQTTMTQVRFEQIMMDTFGTPEDASKSAMTRSEKKIDELVALFSEASTQENIRNTAWAGLNAMTEWYDHFSPTRGDDQDGARAMNAVLDPSFKNKALALMMQEV